MLNPTLHLRRCPQVPLTPTLHEMLEDQVACHNENLVGVLDITIKLPLSIAL